MLLYLAYNLAMAGVEVAPRPICVWIGKAIAVLCFLFIRKKRRAVISNISHILDYTGHDTTSWKGRREIRRLARETFENFAVHIVDFMRIEHIKSDIKMKMINFENFNYFNESLSRGRGLVTITAHVGNWETGAAATASRGCPVNAVTLKLGDRRINDFFTRLRTSGGIRSIPLGKAARSCFQALKRGEIIAFVADRDIDGNGYPIEFFGKQVNIPRGPAEIAARSGAPIMAAFLVQKDDGRFILIAKKPFEVDNTLPLEERVKTIHEATVRIFENYISRYPSQWFAFYKVWN